MSNVVVAHKHQWEMKLALREMERAPDDALTERARNDAIIAGLKAQLDKIEGNGPGLSEGQLAWLSDAVNSDPRSAAFLTA
jgi:hypothetical protein